MKQRVLIVDDEPDAAELAAFNLRAAGFEVSTAGDGSEALRKVRSWMPHLVVLDLMMPEMDGLEVCKLLRGDPRTAKLRILMLTAKTCEVDRILGFELGADDYVTKPFSPRELVLRVKALLRRAEAQTEDQKVISAGELFIDIPEHEVQVHGDAIDLTATEFKLLVTLAQRPGRVQSRDRLLEEVWDYNPGVETRTVDTHMRRLREKLGSAARFLKTVHGVGYRFSPEDI